MGVNSHLHESIRSLRRQGFTYTEINQRLGTTISNSSLSYICKDILLTPAQINRIQANHKKQLVTQRQKALIKNRELFDQKITSYRTKHQSFKQFIEIPNAKFLALAMLYLGEGAKWKGRRGPLLGSSDPNILRLYISLLKDCYGVTADKLKCRVQHRADQDADELVSYWSSITGVDQKNFYPSYADKRTIGQKTKKEDYRGVCVVTCAGTYIQLELEQIAAIIFEAL